MAGRAAVRPDLLQPQEPRLSLVQHRLAAIGVLHVVPVDHAGHEQAPRVHQDVSLAALDLLASVLAAQEAALGGLDRPASDESGSVARLLTLLPAHLGEEGVMDLLQDTGPASAAELGGDSAPEWEVVGQLPPLAASAREVKDSVQEVPAVHRKRGGDFGLALGE
jgi:hypothetical protein